MAGTDHSEPVPEFHRQHIEDEIERLIGLLDFIDPDPELEPNGDDEPSLGSLGSSSTAGQFHWGLNCGGGEDLELDEADDEDNGDREPSLGSIGANFASFDQTAWAAGGRQDFEDDKADAEPSLSAGAHVGHFWAGNDTVVHTNRDGAVMYSWSPWDQSRWGLGGFHDLEEQCEDEGADIDHGDANGCCGATRNYDGPCSPVIGGAQPAAAVS